jgi:hypothetical protein
LHPLPAVTPKLPDNELAPMFVSVGLSAYVQEVVVKLAVSEIGPFMATDAELLVPEYDPEPLPDQPLKL